MGSGQTQGKLYNNRRTPFEQGGQFNPYWDKVGAVGKYDYGVLTMARTLGGGGTNDTAGVPLSSVVGPDILFTGKKKKSRPLFIHLLFAESRWPFAPA